MTTVTKNSVVLPPSTLLTQCDLPKMTDPNKPFISMNVTRDLFTGYLDWRSAALACAARVNRLQDWYRDAEKQVDQH